MRISHKHRFVFLANPKTGSESVSRLLAPYSDPGFRAPVWNEHMAARDLRTLFAERGWDFSGYLKFVVVRNPWARLVSLYEYRKQFYKLDLPPFARWVENLHVTDDAASESVAWLTSKARSFHDASAYTLRAIACDETGRRLVDRVLRLEDLPVALPPLLIEVGVRIGEIPRINTTKHAAYTSYYNDVSRATVARLYREEIEEFGYRFGA